MKNVARMQQGEIRGNLSAQIPELRSAREPRQEFLQQANIGCVFMAASRQVLSGNGVVTGFDNAFGVHRLKPRFTGWRLLLGESLLPQSLDKRCMFSRLQSLLQLSQDRCEITLQQR